jgi:hypothetical protein
MHRKYIVPYSFTGIILLNTSNHVRVMVGIREDKDIFVFVIDNQVPTCLQWGLAG